MFEVEDLKVGMIVKIKELKEIYDTVILLTDITNESCKDRTGRIVYIGEPNTSELDSIFKGLSNFCTVYRVIEEVDGSYK